MGWDGMGEGRWEMGEGTLGGPLFSHRGPEGDGCGYNDVFLELDNQLARATSAI